MALAVDTLSLGQIGTNCYLVRLDRSAREAVVIDPGADVAEIRLTLARAGGELRRDPAHAQPLRPLRRAPVPSARSASAPKWSKWLCVSRIAAQRRPRAGECEPDLGRLGAGSTTTASPAVQSRWSR